MTAMTDTQLVEEFKRQVYLCSGLGKDRMLELVEAQFGERQHKWKFYMNGSFCERCNAQLGSPYTSKECSG